MVMLDGTKILTDVEMINGSIKYVYIICGILCFSPNDIGLTSFVLSANIAPNSA